MIADCEIGLRQARLCNRLKHDKGQLIDCIFLIDRLPADSDVLIHRRTGGTKRMCLQTNFLHSQSLNPEAIQKFESVGFSQLARIDIFFVKRIHVFVEASVAERMVVAFNFQDNMIEQLTA